MPVGPVGALPRQAPAYTALDRTDLPSTRRRDEDWGDWDPRLPISAYHYRKVQHRPAAQASVPAGAAWQSHSQWGGEPPPPPPPLDGRDTVAPGSRRQTPSVHAVPAIATATAADDDSTISRRRRRGGSQRAPASSAPAVRAIRSGQAAWTARGRRLRALLSDEQAGVAELKRELSNLLLAAEASLAEAAEERKLLAAEMQGLLPPLLKEIAVLRARATFWDVPIDKDFKGDEGDGPDSLGCKGPAAPLESAPHLPAGC
jgi:hypothetical protein